MWWRLKQKYGWKERRFTSQVWWIWKVEMNGLIHTQAHGRRNEGEIIILNRIFTATVHTLSRRHTLKAKQQIKPPKTQPSKQHKKQNTTINYRKHSTSACNCHWMMEVLDRIRLLIRAHTHNIIIIIIICQTDLWCVPVVRAACT